MKIWALQYLAGRHEHGIRLFAEDAPPSMERITEILTEWDATHKLDDKLEAIRDGKEYDSDFEWLALRQIEVER